MFKLEAIILRVTKPERFAVFTVDAVEAGSAGGIVRDCEQFLVNICGYAL